MSDGPANHYRIQPSVGVAVGMVIAYMVVVNGLQRVLPGDIGYNEWFQSAEGTYKGAVIPLAAGAVLLITFLLVARWDFLWKDAGRLKMSPLLWAPLVVMVVGIVFRFGEVAWGDLPSGVLLAIALAGIGVGFTEEILFRGIVLRMLRANGRSEAHAVLWTSVGFGAFHVGNMLLGASVIATLGQMCLAGTVGVTLYLGRRAWGLIVPAMVLHGVYDASTFYTEAASKKSAFGSIALLCYVLTIILSLVALVHILRTDNDYTMGSNGPEPIGPAPADLDPSSS